MSNPLSPVARPHPRPPLLRILPLAAGALLLAGAGCSTAGGPRTLPANLAGAGGLTASGVVTPEGQRVARDGERDYAGRGDAGRGLAQGRATGRNHPAWNFTASVGAGEFAQETRGGSVFDDDTRAAIFQGRIEHVANLVGGGIQFTGLSVDDDLNQNAGNAADTGLFEVFPHLTVRPRAGRRFRMPLRVGPAFSFLAQDFDNGDEIYYSTISLQFEAEPEFDIVQSNHFRLSAFGAFRGGPGSTWIGFEGTGLDEDYSTDAFHFGLETGLRFQFEGFQMGFSYVRRDWQYDESDVENGTFVEETDYDFHGVMFTFGGRW